VSLSTPHEAPEPSKYTSPCFQQLRTAKMGIPKFLYCPTLPQMARALNQKDGRDSQFLCKSHAGVPWRGSWAREAKTLECGKVWL
jgi:hypothetical protein